MEALQFKRDISSLRAPGHCGEVWVSLSLAHMVKELNHTICAITGRTESLTGGEKLNEHEGNKKSGPLKWDKAEHERRSA